MMATNLVTGDTSNVAATFDAECRFEAEIDVGEYRITFTRRGFDSVNVDSVRIRSFETYDLGARILPRALGSIEGNFNLQGRLEHDGINITVRKQVDPELGETAPTYTVQTVAPDAECLGQCARERGAPADICLPDDVSEKCRECKRRCASGRFSIAGLWAGSYIITAVKDGFEQKTLSQVVLVDGLSPADATHPDSSPDANQDGVVILQRATGDFLINGGADYTNDSTVKSN